MGERRNGLKDAQIAIMFDCAPDEIKYIHNFYAFWFETFIGANLKLPTLINILR